MALILEVIVNGERFALAGDESLSVLTAHVTASGKLGGESHGIRTSMDAADVSLSVHGLTNRGGRERDEHMNWGKRLLLHVGDEVRILVREGNDYDSASRRHPVQDYPSSFVTPRKRFLDAKALYFRLRGRYGTRAEKQEAQWRRRVIPHLR